MALISWILLQHKFTQARLGRYTAWVVYQCMHINGLYTKESHDSCSTHIERDGVQNKLDL